MEARTMHDLLYEYLSFSNYMNDVADNDKNENNKELFNNILNLIDEIGDNISRIEENEGYNF